MADFSMNGTGGVQCVTMLLDKTTIAAIGKEYDGAKGKAVALTGNNTVGYGSDGDPLFGVIRKVESDGYATVQVKGFACGIIADVTKTTGENPVAITAIGTLAAVDGTGGIKSAAGSVTSRGYITSMDTAVGKADIIM